MRQQQATLDQIGGYFTSGNILTVGAGGTGVNLASVPNGSLLIYNSSNVGIGTFGQGSAGQIVVSNGPNALPSWSGVTTKQIFLSSGTFTAPSGCNLVYLNILGSGGNGGGTAGGAGSNPGGSGASGSYLKNLPYVVVPGNTYTVTVGTGSGGASSFDTVSVPGGTNGSQGNAGGGGTGGTSSSATFATYGSYDYAAGSNGVNGGAGGGASAGQQGGSNMFGAGGAAGTAFGGAGGNAAANTGAGGGSSGGTNGGAVSGGLGGSGFVIVSY
jgi:hypothetical protein